MSTDRRVRVIGEDDFSVIEKIDYKLDPKIIYEYVVGFTKIHKKYSTVSKVKREVECLRYMFPKTFQPVENDQFTIGKLYVMPVGIGCTTTVGGVGYYAQFGSLENLKNQLQDSEEKEILSEIIEYWKENDSREKFFRDNLVENEMGRFVETEYPSIVTTRLSGMYLDYNLLCDLGIDGIKKKIEGLDNKNDFHFGLLECLEIFKSTIDHLILDIKDNCDISMTKWKKMLNALERIKSKKPNSFLSALQLTWIYSLMSGVINYGRMDDYLGDYLVNDLESGEINWEDALMYVRTLFDHMEQRRTLANSRVIIGGKGRRNPEKADVFCKLAIEAVMKNRDIEPQLTLRYYKGMNQEVYDLALDCVEMGTTFPIIYNDDVNIPSLMNAMNIDEKTAEKYVPLGCGEINLSGCGVSTPNTCINMLKVLTITLNGGVDPFDGKRKCGNLKLSKLDDLSTFDDFFEEYKKVLDYYIEMTARGQKASYEYLNDDINFLFTSMLIDDCILRGKPVLGGGVRYLGGTNETYGNISTGDSLYAIKKLVYDERKYTLKEIADACLHDFEGYEDIFRDMNRLEYFGNDIDEVDEIQQLLHDHTCLYIREQAKKVGMDYYLVVMINNQIGTQWGLDTWASPNGRHAKTYMSNGNNPQSGKDHNGPTAMLTSLTKLSPAIHAGAVHNMKFSKELFKEHRDMIKSLLSVYFETGAQIMITVVGKDELVDAYKNPEKYPNLVVRVGGFSARFIDLNKEVQKEVMERTLN